MAGGSAASSLLHHTNTSTSSQEREMPVDRPRNGVRTVSVLLPCLAYSACSVSMVIANKGLATSFHSNLDMLVVVYQCVVAVVLVQLAKRMGYAEVEAFQVRTALRWLPVNLFFVSMLATNFLALKFVSVPMVTVFKNLTNIIITAGDWRLNGQRVSPPIVACLAVMTVGAVMASYHDISFSFWGYLWMSANCCCTAGYVLAMRFATKTIKLSKFSMIYYNNALSVALLLPLAVSRGELILWAQRTDLHTPSYLLLNTFAGGAGFFLNYASLWCISVTSATTYSIIGSINKIPTTFLGYFLFDTAITRQTAIFIAVGMAGGFLYSYAKTQEAQQASSSKAKLTPMAQPKAKALPRYHKDAQQVAKGY